MATSGIAEVDIFSATFPLGDSTPEICMQHLCIRRYNMDSRKKSDEISGTFFFFLTFFCRNPVTIPKIYNFKSKYVYVQHKARYKSERNGVIGARTRTLVTISDPGARISEIRYY